MSISPLFRWPNSVNHFTFWLDDEAIQAWYESATPSSRGRPQRYSDLAITTVLVIKRV
ncbi:transposase, partial (plasmid) [Enterobacter roggenkampii]